MAFTNYGSGNWFGLPELGITEALGGNKQSVYNAIQNTANSSPYYGTQNTPTYDYSNAFSPYSSTYTPTSPSGGSGGGSGGGPAPVDENGNPVDTGPSDEELNSVYDPMMNTLSSQENTLRGNEQNYYNMATTPFSSQIPLVQQAGQQGQNSITTQQNTTGVQEQNALAAARRLYDELTSRNRQAFGSGALGSVGQASGEILGRTAQQGFGQVRSTADETMQKLYTASRDLQQQTDAQINSLEQQKASALSQAQIWFRDKLDEITSARNQVESDKANRKLDALQQYRDYVRSLSDQANQLKQSIIATAAANGQSITQAINQYNQGMGQTIQGGATNVANQGTSNALSYANLGQGNQLSAASPQSTLEAQGVYAGQLPTQVKKNPYDLYA
jgi:hypothetical protein